MAWVGAPPSPPKLGRLFVSEVNLPHVAAGLSTSDVQQTSLAFAAKGVSRELPLNSAGLERRKRRG